jgi:hypothetical protein
VTEHEDNEPSPDSGVKQVGGTAEAEKPAQSKTAPVTASDGGRSRPRLLVVAATLGVIGTLVFGALWLGAPSGGTTQNPAVKSAATAFLTDFFNFNAKSIDTDFNAVTAMATGNFSSQAGTFFNSAIRQELEKALAESRGQIRDLYVQSESGTAASVYAVVDQVYVNNKINTPQSDVVRLIINLSLVKTTWKISNVTVLEGATPASAGSASGSAGSDVPGQ